MTNYTFHMVILDITIEHTMFYTKHGIKTYVKYIRNSNFIVFRSYSCIITHKEKISELHGKMSNYMSWCDKKIDHMINYSKLLKILTDKKIREYEKILINYL